MKRAVSVFFCLIFSLALLLLRLFSIAAGGSVPGAQAGGTLTVEAARGRGFIYDRNGLPFVNETAQLAAVAAPLETVPRILRAVSGAEDFAAAYARLSKGYPAVLPVREEVTGRGVFTVRAPVRYSADFLIPHIAGYCDATGHGVCGLEKTYDSLLSERICTVTFDADAAGRVLCGGNTRIDDGGLWSRSGVVLTIEKRLQAMMRDAMLRSDIRKGAAVLLDAQTGEIRAMVSLPEFDPANPQRSLQSADAPFLNRALCPVSVGSVYKMLVAAAALEQGVGEDFTYTCTGETLQDDVTFHCHLRAGHGTLDLAGAMAESCNPWFIHLLREIPVDSLLNLSRRMGLGSAVTLCDDVVCGAGTVPESGELQTDAARANIAFGQGRLTAAPLQIAAATAACVNGGTYHEPRLIDAILHADGSRTAMQAAMPEHVLSAGTSERIRRLLIYAAGQTRQITCADCGGKTATAQTGIFHAGREQLNTWYSGFFPAENPQYVLTSLCEDGTSGAGDCAPVFDAVAAQMEKNH